jgi:4-aminobutyrate aminotransferase
MDQEVLSIMKTHTIPGKKALKYLERDRAVISPSYSRALPFMMDHGMGSEVWDVDGNRFIDFASGIAVCSTGHCHPKVVEAIKEQADHFLHISPDFHHLIWIELSERLASIKPFKEPAKVFLGNSGTEAVEASIKLARHHTGRQYFIGFFGGFHGRTMGSLSITASKAKYRRGFMPLMNGVTHVPFPDPYRPILQQTHTDYGETVVHYIEDVVLKRILPPEDCAAILLEPILGEGGYIIPPNGFFPALRRLCDKYGFLLIVDEVQSGAGRTGRWWAIEHWKVEPDIVCTAKGIASGLPLGGIIARESVVDWGYGSHGNTFGGNPISCAAALATLDLIENGMMDNAAEVGQYTLDALAEIQVRHPSMGDLRGKGLMIGIELVKDRNTREPAYDLREQILNYAFEYGLLMLGCGESAIRIAPALNISRNLIDEGLEILETAITSAEKDGLN